MGYMLAVRKASFPMGELGLSRPKSFYLRGVRW
jgi:hypothetical protein